MESAPKTVISVTGLGYVGWPLALAFARQYSVVAFDHDPFRIAALRRLTSGTRQRLCLTDDCCALRRATFHIIAVPTPVDEHHRPDIGLLLRAAATVGRALKKGDVVVLESSVYPGCTENDVLPVLQRESGLTVDADFGLAYSPERINPGDAHHTVENVTKVVAAHNAATLHSVDAVYRSIVKAGLCHAPNIRTAEAAKLLENTQRDVNIALMNEMAVICRQMGIETADVIAAASTKWNFALFRPGLVGGHCVGVDPYYLSHAAHKAGAPTPLIDSARRVNSQMGRFVARETAQRMQAKGLCPQESRVCVLGICYKENVADVRNSRAADIVAQLQELDFAAVDVIDPVADAAAVMTAYGIELAGECTGRYEAIIAAVAHDAFTCLGPEFFGSHLSPGGVVADVCGIFRHQTEGLDVWRL